ncbi:MAG: hypothetical protein H7A55_13390 [Verrucomicrobiaceae bacterium]|nr:hypothetical protein [Verrucomicrobiaceae bacterium]
MSDAYNSNGSPPRRRNRNRRGGNNNYRPKSASSSDDFRTPGPRRKPAKPTGFQKWLGILTFGLLGGAKKTPDRPKPATKSGDRPPRPQGQSGQRSGERSGEPRPRREQVVSSPLEVTTERLYVGNLSYDATESDLAELFNGVGTVESAEVVVNGRTQRSKGFAFVTMGSVTEARRAVEVLSGQDFMGRPLQLSGAKPNSRNDREDNHNGDSAAADAETSDA